MRPSLAAPPLVPGLALTPLPRPARGPRSAPRLLAVGARRGARGGGARRAGSAAAGGARPPPPSPRVGRLPAAPTQPPLSASLGGGGGTGGGARDHSSGGDLVRRRQFGSSIFLPSERQERTSWERVRTRFLEGGGAFPHRGHAPSVIRLAPLTPSHPPAVPQIALCQRPPHL